MDKTKYEILKFDTGLTFNLPIYLNGSVDEMGVMSGFDGGMEQIEQLVNFTYTQTGSTIQVYSTINPDKLRKIIEQTYTINWGDGLTSGLTVNSGVPNTSFPTISHTYTGITGYTITITLDSPWTTQKLKKEIHTNNFFTGHTGNVLGTFTGVTIPAYSNLTGQTQDYLNDLDYTNNTGYTQSGFTYLAIGGSRLQEKKLYGSNTYVGVSGGTDSIGVYSGYSFTYTGNTTGTTIMYYRDYLDGYTLITGSTTGFTKEEVFNTTLTRNEHFLGFVDEPTIYSDIFVERGKQGVMEKNLRLGEIDNIGEMENYGNGYFTIRKQ